MAKFKIDTDRVRTRADFFLNESNHMSKMDRFSRLDFKMDESHALNAAECYFLISEAYKALRQENPKHKTQYPKIAAMTSMVIVHTNPFRPTKPVNETNKEILYANPLLALRLGCNIVDHPFAKRPSIQKSNFCEGMLNSKLPCLDNYLLEMRDGTRHLGDSYDVELSIRELREIDTRLSFFQVLGEMPVYKGPRKYPNISD